MNVFVPKTYRPKWKRTPAPQITFVTAPAASPVFRVLNDLALFYSSGPNEPFRQGPGPQASTLGLGCTIKDG